MVIVALMNNRLLFLGRFRNDIIRFASLFGRVINLKSIRKSAKVGSLPICNDS